jgi:hypothetical protein
VFRVPSYGVTAGAGFLKSKLTAGARSAPGVVALK